MIDITALTESDVGRAVLYEAFGSQEDAAKGRIVSWAPMLVGINLDGVVGLRGYKWVPPEDLTFESPAITLDDSQELSDYIEERRQP